MNGRIYDPVIGRFLQADPIVQEPFNGQNFNRYTYVLNNPLAYTDPTGYSFWTEVRRPVGAIIAAYLTYNATYFFLTEGTVGVLAPAVLDTAQAVSAVASGFAAGGIAGGNVESAVLGAFSGGLLNAVGAAAPIWYEKALAHALIGCMGAGTNGDCGRSALAGGFASLAGSALATSDLKGWDNMATRAVIGGASSALAGGKFANGAFTAAFNYLLNDDKHPDSPEENNKQGENTAADRLVGQGLKLSAHLLVPGLECVTEGCGAGGMAMAAIEATPPGKGIKLLRAAKGAVDGLGFTRSQLQHAFKHAKDFGVTGNANNKTLSEFSTVLQTHVDAVGTRAIQGTYRANSVTHHVDPRTGLNVIRDSSGNFLSGWKLSPQQLQHVLTTGKLGGG